MRTFAVTALIVAAMLLSTAGPAAAADPRYLGVEGAFVYVHEGQPVEDPESAFEDPSVGDAFYFTERIYASNTDGDKGDRVGRLNVECVFGVKLVLVCDAVFRFKDRGQLFIATVPGDTRRFRIAVLGGTGEFRDAGGQIIARELRGPRTLYRFQLGD